MKHKYLELENLFIRRLRNDSNLYTRVSNMSIDFIPAKNIGGIGALGLRLWLGIC